MPADADNDERVAVFSGTLIEAEVIRTMLRARGIDAAITGEHSLTTDEHDAVLLVPPAEVEAATALVADVQSGAAERDA